MELTGFLLVEVACGGGPPQAGQAGRGGRRDEELEEAAGRCPPPRVLGTATLQVRRALGSRLGLWADSCGGGGGAGPRVGRPFGLAGGGARVLALRGGGTGAEVPRGDVNSFHSSVARAGGWQRGILCSKTPFPTCCVTWGQSLLLSEPQDHLTFGQCSSDFPSLACAGKQAARQSLPWGEEWCAYWGPVAPGPVPSPGYGSGCAQSRRPGEPRPPGEGDADEVPGEGTRFFPPKPCAAQKANC